LNTCKNDPTYVHMPNLRIYLTFPSQYRDFVENRHMKYTAEMIFVTSVDKISLIARIRWHILAVEKWDNYVEHLFTYVSSCILSRLKQSKQWLSSRNNSIENAKKQSPFHIVRVKSCIVIFNFHLSCCI
jgi:hypothetical protein